MELSILTATQHQLRPNPPLKSIFRPCFNPSNGGKHTLLSLPCRCSISERVENPALVSSLDSSTSGRRCLLGSFVIATSALLNMYDVAGAVSTSRRALRGAKVPESEFTTLPNGLNYTFNIGAHVCDLRKWEK
ncbi:peptidyl-prolyl cis-trans isomerase FKBP16-4, chloroplastic-like isoform X2 [Dioscorea cayenensis subsp. rotundata]|uniref:Peptidyl-prolyl cis-trans isomerase FKBP16-4, chloroplastic-like isoform X2 n=1 Tax=Dioscorea cayennensis subsp. rotundata TaxID=55577 RepID=A0AB40CHU1_DIOCR|nr:peptidyl-prolyl cis-trans isomerase FKBP16-4, chloroplastic-like isoform X2 [Dioscorea cayenensis subsp. rotundata]